MDTNSPPVGKLELTDKMSRYSYPFAITVNKEGRRFMDEGRDTFEPTYAATGDLIGKQTDSTAFQIFDQKSLITLEPRYSTGTPVVDDTLDGLAAKLGVNVREFNAAVPDTPDWDPFHKDGRSTGDKLEIAKTNWSLTIDKPPYVAYAVTCELRYHLHLRRLKVDPYAHVLNAEGNRVPGLWAIGEIAGGFFAYNYPGASGLVKGAVFGRLAGAAAAKGAIECQRPGKL
ncbi:uncharacterized protein Z518_00113 [Rhinocladiella mackenziei CBS 650.93]|uniref:Rhinocladiella mackenziei CBS 650.93 unplaced genomic scaffold supercont1.1, whole genome shotgun sequence n=1 Tax=Rhinocladiella mackenziei CBS 650.93 TaxID=1442369 RepID=A0A0D2JI62_9EURO|nr:uncharacterized protein Z518_00113 [Rhinocladiella mackenziei CBS 650.93]KIX09035.1 hypothetical protein Z518_00113 [Rhinocladiella mackenziei CBS 650.93]